MRINIAAPLPRFNYRANEIRRVVATEAAVDVARVVTVLREVPAGQRASRQLRHGGGVPPPRGNGSTGIGSGNPLPNSIRNDTLAAPDSTTLIEIIISMANASNAEKLERALAPTFGSRDAVASLLRFACTSTAVTIATVSVNAVPDTTNENDDSFPAWAVVVPVIAVVAVFTAAFYLYRKQAMPKFPMVTEMKEAPTV